MRLDVTYDAEELVALTDANKLIITLREDVVYCQPAWQKLYRVGNYIKTRQEAVVAEALAAPEEEVVHV